MEAEYYNKYCTLYTDYHTHTYRPLSKQKHNITVQKVDRGYGKLSGLLNTTF